MIRAFRNEDSEAVVTLWLEASLQAHAFVGTGYWESKVEDMRTLYLPLSEIVVDADEATGEITGFAALVEDFLAALFVAPRHQGKGTGTRLLKLAQKMRGTLELSVYAENERAVEFYRKHGFKVVGQGVEEATGHLELTMRFGG